MFLKNDVKNDDISIAAILANHFLNYYFIQTIIIYIYNCKSCIYFKISWIVTEK